MKQSFEGVLEGVLKLRSGGHFVRIQRKPYFGLASPPIIFE